MMRRIGIHLYNSKPLKKYLSTSIPLNEKNKYPTKELVEEYSKHFVKPNSNKNEFVRHETNRQYTPRSQPRSHTVS